MLVHYTKTIPGKTWKQQQKSRKKTIDISKYIFIQAPARATASLTAKFLNAGK